MVKTIFKVEKYKLVEQNGVKQPFIRATNFYITSSNEEIATLRRNFRELSNDETEYEVSAMAALTDGQFHDLRFVMNRLAENYGEE